MTSEPCIGCGRVVAKVAGSKSNKRRVRHMCDHGEWCVFGHRLLGNQGMNWPTCKGCYADRVREYRARQNVAKHIMSAFS